MSANITVVPAMPDASVNAAVPVNVFARHRLRHAQRRSCLNASSIAVRHAPSCASSASMRGGANDFRSLLLTLEVEQATLSRQQHRIVQGIAAPSQAWRQFGPTATAGSRFSRRPTRRRNRGGSGTGLDMKHVQMGRTNVCGLSAALSHAHATFDVGVHGPHQPSTFDLCIAELAHGLLCPKK
jgi:hypothetical protein